ncbi:flagellar hook-associated protein FlgL [Pseudidiomarina insulisalsae]|uniref:Flagellar hook-associated protein 3 n=1 Tax=Pseudidiomarina insulisalsae TaxID=575789 RepID=A0A432YDK2_9GAMM|nr:flagellar hook-associated protein FlgL [Pseudidiomarina insulisalsae]RUO59044.1 flagellar hook-associated protein 3 [Pseudidiomarina insulisalsae]
MRISTLTMYNLSVSSMNQQQAAFNKVSQQIASGKRVVSLADDPQALTQALGVRQAQALGEQYASARVGVENALAQEENALNSVTDIYSRAKTLLVQASSESLADADRSAIASELTGLYDALLGVANTRNADGRYLFGGYQDDTAPFIKDAGGAVQFVGSKQVREQQVDGNRRMAMGHNGAEVFSRVHGSAGYGVEAAMENQGAARFGTITINNPDHANFGQAYSIEFVEQAGELGYSVNGGAVQAYQQPMQIALDGIELELSGTPVAGDRFNVAPGDALNTNMFTTFERAIAVLNQPSNTESARATRANQLRSGLQQLDHGLDNVLTTRAEVGARLNELETLEVMGGTRKLSQAQTLSDLVDLNYAEASAEYSLRIVGLQAAQKSFMSIQDMSLFKLL